MSELVKIRAMRALINKCFQLVPGILHFGSSEWASIEVRYKTEQERHASIKLQMTNVIRLGQSTSPFSHQSQVLRESDLVQLVAGTQLCLSALG